MNLKAEFNLFSNNIWTFVEQFPEYQTLDLVSQTLGHFKQVEEALLEKDTPMGLHRASSLHENACNVLTEVLNLFLKTDESAKKFLENEGSKLIIDYYSEKKSDEEEKKEESNDEVALKFFDCVEQEEAKDIQVNSGRKDEKRHKPKDNFKLIDILNDDFRFNGVKWNGESNVDDSNNSYW